MGRGGSSTGLLWGDASRDDLASFESRLLPGAAAPDLANSATFDLQVDAPEVAPDAEGAGLVDVEGSTGKAAWRRRLSPRHRDAVRAFFSGPEDE